MKAFSQIKYAVLLLNILLMANYSIAASGVRYMTVSIGGASLQLPSDDFNTQWSADKASSKTSGSTAFHIDGGYLFYLGESKTFQLGPEVGFTTYNEGTGNYVLINQDTNKPSEMKYSGNYFDLLAKANYHFTSTWSANAKLGVAAVTQKRNYIGPPTVKIGTGGVPVSLSSNTENKVLPELAAGFNVSFNSQFGIGGEVSAIDGDEINVKDIFDYDPKSGTVNPEGGKKVASVVTIMFAAHYNF